MELPNTMPSPNKPAAPATAARGKGPGRDFADALREQPAGAASDGVTPTPSTVATAVEVAAVVGAMTPLAAMSVTMSAAAETLAEVPVVSANKAAFAGEVSGDALVMSAAPGATPAVGAGHEMVAADRPRPATPGVAVGGAATTTPVVPRAVPATPRAGQAAGGVAASPEVAANRPMTNVPSATAALPQAPPAPEALTPAAEVTANQPATASAASSPAAVAGVEAAPAPATPPPAAPPPPPPSPAAVLPEPPVGGRNAEALVDGVRRAGDAAASQRGTGTTTVRLDPPSLGSVRVHVRVAADGQVSATIGTSSELAHGLVRGSVDQLASALERAGVSMDRVQVTRMSAAPADGGGDAGSRHGDGQSQGREQAQQQQRDQARREATLRMWGRHRDAA